MRSIAIVTLIALFETACAPSAPLGTSLGPSPQIVTINVRGRARDTLLFAGIDLSGINTRVGAHYDGWLKIRQYWIDANPTLLNTWSGWMRSVGTQEFEAAGYHLKVPSSVFGQFQDYSGVRYAVAGKPTLFELNTYGRLAGNTTQASVQIAWEVFDVRTRDVIYRRQTSGEAKTSGNSGDAVAVAYRSAVQQLLSDQAFVNAVISAGVAAASPGPQAATLPVTQTFVNWHHSLPSESELVPLSASKAKRDPGKSALEDAEDAVVSLRGSQALGTAFLVSSDGLALTNYHVVRNQGAMTARFRGGLEEPVRIIRSDSAADVALVEVFCPTACATMELAAPGFPRIGTDVYAIGTPLSLAFSHSVTKGVVAGLRRSGTTAFLQTDAAVNPGNSGGPLVDARTGACVGIVTAKIVERGVEGMAFAIAIDDALRVLGISRP